MPASALALVVLAGLIHACWNIAAKKAGGDARFSCFSSLVMMVFWAPVGLWLGWQQIPAWGAVQWWLVGVSGVLHTVYFVVLLRGYRKADLTVVYPLARGSGPLLSSLVAILFLGEHISAASLLGSGWDRPYSREVGAFPLATLKVVKYWPPVGRVDNVYGDRNLFCSCVPLTEYANA